MKVVQYVVDALRDPSLTAPVEIVSLCLGEAAGVVAFAVVVEGSAIDLIGGGLFAAPSENFTARRLSSRAEIDELLGGADVVDAAAARELVRAAFPVVVAVDQVASGVPQFIVSANGGEPIGLLDAASGLFESCDGEANSGKRVGEGVVSFCAASAPSQWNDESAASAVTYVVPSATGGARAPTVSAVGLVAPPLTPAEASTLAIKLLPKAPTSAWLSFWPAELVIPLRMAADAQQRLRVHRQLALPNRPLFRAGLEVDVRRGWAAAPSSSLVARHGEKWEAGLVRSIHTLSTAKRAPVAEDAEVALVDGAYDYYHYCVDGFQDDGWGCAYRSLQSLLSWFQYAGLMPQPNPSVRKIQEILVLVDAEKQRMEKFVGSRTWIGSFEVMMVLQYFVPNVECAIKRMERGAELWESSEIKQLIAQHFRRSKCPIMIGGSDYAHTILGIEWSVLSPSAVVYLILDPHYSARTTDPKVALSKGWCGWKDPAKFFNKESWYNMCIPHVAGTDFRV